MGENHVTIGKSFDEVVRNAAIEITGDYFREHIECMKSSIINSVGHPIDFSATIPPPELKIYMNAFASGVGNVLAAVLTGKLDLYVIKKAIRAGNEEPTQ